MDFALETKIAKLLPHDISMRLGALYNIYRSKQADREFKKRSQPDLEKTNQGPDHILLCTIDALRADQVDRNTMPFLSDLHQIQGISTAPWTFPAVSSILTGEYPNEHGAIRQSDNPTDGAAHETLPPKIPPTKIGMTDIFAGTGYRTFGAFGNIMPFLALSGRFHRHSVQIQAPAARLVDLYSDWKSSNSTSKTFGYLHFSDLHMPVDPPSEYWKMYEVDADIPNITTWDYTDTVEQTPEIRRYRNHRKRLYSAAARYVDDQLQMLYNDLYDSFGDNFLFLVTSDHGEAFWEMAKFDKIHFTDSRPAYSVKHGGTPYESLARVPILSNNDNLIQSGTASLVDIAPTLLSSINLSEKFETTGYSLFHSVPEDRIPIIESVRYGYEKKAAYTEEWKLIVSRGDHTSVGFSLPEEQPITLPEDIEEKLRASFPKWPGGDSESQTVSAHEKERLKDLGYM